MISIKDTNLPSEEYDVTVLYTALQYLEPEEQTQSCCVQGQRAVQRGWRQLGHLSLLLSSSIATLGIIQPYIIGALQDMIGGECEWI